MKNKLLLLTFSILVFFYFPYISIGQPPPIILHNQRELFIDNYLVEKLNNIDTRLAIPVSAGAALQFNEPVSYTHLTLPTNREV